MALLLRQNTSTGFTNKNAELTNDEIDNNWIELNAAIEANTDAIGNIHAQNTDTKLDEGGANEVTAAAIKTVVDAGTSRSYASFGQNGNTSDTTVSVAGTYVDIACTLGAGTVSNSNFSATDNVLTYSGSTTKTFILNWNMRVIKESGSAGDSVRMRILVEGVAQSFYAAVDLDNSVLGDISGVWLVTLESGDEITIELTNNDSTCTAKVQDQTITLHQI